MSMFLLLEGWVGVCAFLCVGWNVPPEVCVDCCALCVRVRVHVCARHRVLFDRRFRFDHVFGRPSRAPRRHGLACGAHCMVCVGAHCLCVAWGALVGVHCLVRVGWCELVGARWSASSLVCIACCALVGARWLVWSTPLPRFRAPRDQK